MCSLPYRCVISIYYYDFDIYVHAVSTDWTEQSFLMSYNTIPRNAIQSWWENSFDISLVVYDCLVQQYGCRGSVMLFP